MLKKNSYFIAATGTDIGKTYLVQQILNKIPHSKAIKPIISGFNFEDDNSDSAKILRSQNDDVNPENIKKISPWRFVDPVSPHFAAEIEKTPIDFDKVVEFCRNEIELAAKNDYFLFIESAGGVMSPITYDKTFLDLAQKLDIDIILLGANYLGAISHILTSVGALQRSNLHIEKIIINDNVPNLVMEKNDIIKTIENFTKVDTLLLDNFCDQLN